jgi:diaminopimelate epimerase
MKLQFTKMHGLGNDMIVIDSLASGWVPRPDQARFLGDRRRGVGADQMLILLPSSTADFKMRIFNQDGSEVEMCGNGIRCLARYIHARGLSPKNPLAIETLAGIIRPERKGDQVRVDMGAPVFEAERIPLAADLARTLKGARPRDQVIQVDDDSFRMSAVSMGNPHCVIPVERVDEVPLETFGPRLEHHPWFPRRANIEFVEVIGRAHLKVRVWERGAGATLACGTGACAAAVAMIDLGLADPDLIVSLPGGDLAISWQPPAGPVFMTGPATFVFEGVIEL